MYKPTTSSGVTEVILTAEVDDGGTGPTQSAADFDSPSGPVASYTVPSGYTLEVQQVGAQLVWYPSEASGWETLQPLFYDSTASAALYEDVAESRFAPGVVVGGWCFFDAFFSVPSGHDFQVGMNNPTSDRARVRFVIRGWLVPDT